MKRVIVLVLLQAFIYSSVVFAKDKDNFDTQTFKPAVNTYGLAVHESGEIERHLDFRVGLIWNYSRKPVVLVDPNTKNEILPLVSDRVTQNLVFALGLADYLEFGLDLPITLYQKGNRYGNISKSLVNFSLGDLRLMLKIGGFLRHVKHGVALSFQLAGSFPTSQNKSLVGNRFLTFTPQINFSVGNVVYWGINFGYTLTRNMIVYDVPIQDTLNYGMAFGVNIQKIRMTIFAEAWGQALADAPFKNMRTSPAEVALGLKFAITKVHFIVGGGFGVTDGVGSPNARAFLGISYCQYTPDRDFDGIMDADDQCPDDPEDKDGFEDEDGCPDTDNDKDGILDVNDKCPNDPEDKDGFQDEDGCPDPDNDNDGIPDEKDQCPLDPEDIDKFEDADGCPDPDNDKDKICDPWVSKMGLLDKYKDICKGTDQCPDEAETMNNIDDEDGCPDSLVILSDTEIKIKEKVYFDTAKATIKPVSFTILDQVADVMLKHPEILLIRIEGHTDKRGGAAYNRKLSHKRAESVYKYLMNKGIAPERMIFQGYGFDKPLVEGKGEAVWSQNRRVQFMILKKAP
jgi:outer membrane protein OmpA-like peptidoglycan-associated protein